MHDIIVIGAGSGGLNIAGFMNKAGFKVLLVDKKDETIGGDCLNFGCVPSKALIHVSRLANDSHAIEKFGLKSSGKIDLSKVMDYVKSKQDIIRTHENAEYFRSIGMDVVLGRAKFAGENSIELNGKKYRAKKIVIATGSIPRKLKIPGIDKVDFLTNETIFNLGVLPEKLLVIGGGPIGIELGQAFLGLGSKVCIIQNGPMFLPKEDPEIARVLYNKLLDEGMEIHFNTKPVEFTGSNTVKLDSGKIIEFSNILISIGRELSFESLNPDKAGIKTLNNKLVLDAYLRTSNKNVFAVGDAAG